MLKVRFSFRHGWRAIAEAKVQNCVWNMLKRWWRQCRASKDMENVSPPKYRGAKRLKLQRVRSSIFLLKTPFIAKTTSQKSFTLWDISWKRFLSFGEPGKPITFAWHRLTLLFIPMTSLHLRSSVSIFFILSQTPLRIGSTLSGGKILRKAGMIWCWRSNANIRASRPCDTIRPVTIFCATNCSKTSDRKSYRPCVILCSTPSRRTARAKHDFALLGALRLCSGAWHWEFSKNSFGL